MPLHTWLPHAHPAAPSHVSGVMSGVIIKMGIYGILRCVIYLPKEHWMTMGATILIVSILSGVMGVIYAIMQHDVKKLLAYHSIENIGIIGIGTVAARETAARNAEFSTQSCKEAKAQRAVRKVIDCDL